MLKKYFIAIVPPEPLLSQIQELKHTIFNSYQTKGALNSPPHITLHMPFSWEETKEERLISTLQKFQFSNSFTISLKDFQCFEPRVIYIDIVENEHLYALQKALVDHVKKQLHLYNQSDDMRGFHPHITIAFRDLKKKLFYEIWEEYKNKTFEAGFTCASISLLKQEEHQWEVFKNFDFNS